MERLEHFQSVEGDPLGGFAYLFKRYELSHPLASFRMLLTGPTPPFVLLLQHSTKPSLDALIVGVDVGGQQVQYLQYICVPL